MSDSRLIILAAFFNNKKLMDDMKKNWDRLLPITFYYDHVYENEQKKISDALNTFYFNNEPFYENPENLTKVCTSRLYLVFRPVLGLSQRENYFLSLSIPRKYFQLLMLSDIFRQGRTSQPRFLLLLALERRIFHGNFRQRGVQTA